MKKKPLISIIVPVYNVEKYIRRCVESLLNQTYLTIEVILVNDGSPDKSPEICDDYCKMDNRVSVLHKNNGGLSDARNSGLEKARGDYIIFLDSDDYVEHTMVEDAVKAAERDNSDVVIWGYYADFVSEDENLISTKMKSCISGSFSKSDLSKLTITNELIGCLGYAWNKMYRKKFLMENKYRFTSGLSLVEDIVFNGPVLSKVERITFIEKPYVHYMQRPRETLGVKFYENFYELKIMAMKSVESILCEWGINTREISLVKSRILFDALKATTRLLTKASNYNRAEKKGHLNSLLNNSEVQSSLKVYNPKKIKDKIMKFLMLKQKTDLLLTIYNAQRQIVPGGDYDQ